LATGFVLIPALGIRATTWVGVALNLLAAAGARWLATIAWVQTSDERAPAERPPRSKAARKTATRARTGPAPAPAEPGLAAAAAAASGFCALVYEVNWTRLGALIIGPTTYAFAIVVASFIVGLALGSAIAARLLPRVSRPAEWLGAVLAPAAGGASAARWDAGARPPPRLAAQVAAPDAAFGSIVTGQAIGTVLLLLPMTLALGAAFPLALATASATGGDVGVVSARIFGANTIGAVTGSLAGGFFFLPRLGLQTSLR